MSIRTSGISRRGFVKGLGLAALAPTIVPSAVFGSDASTSPNERITVGVIGTGKMAFAYHIPALLKLNDVQVVAVCDVDTLRRQEAKRRVEEAYSKDNKAYKGCPDYNDFRDVLARKDIDAVLIATPDHWHAIPLIEACKVGKDVYCEKPLTLTLREAQVCIDAVRNHNRVFQTGSQQRSNVFGKFCEAVEFIRSGRLGEIKQVTVGVGKPSRPCDLPEERMEPGLDWDMWLGYAPKRAYNSILSPRGIHKHFPAWRDYREYSGGSHTDMGAHYYDIVQWALDMDNSGPVDIIPPENTQSGSGCKYVYANGIEVIHGGPDGCVFTGTKGTMHIARGVLKSNPESIITEPLGEKDVHVARSPGHHRNWVDCIRSRQQPVASIEAGARTVAIPLLGNLAYWNGRRLKWDPQNWQFVGDDTANTWLDYARRDAWQLPTV